MFPQTDFNDTTIRRWENHHPGETQRAIENARQDARGCLNDLAEALAITRLRRNLPSLIGLLERIQLEHETIQHKHIQSKMIDWQPLAGDLDAAKKLLAGMALLADNKSARLRAAADIEDLEQRIAPIRQRLHEMESTMTGLERAAAAVGSTIHAIQSLSMPDLTELRALLLAEPEPPAAAVVQTGAAKPKPTTRRRQTPEPAMPKPDFPSEDSGLAERIAAFME